MFGEKFWVALAFFIFVALVIKPFRKFVLGGIDNNIADIKKELQQAEDLRKEAEAIMDRARKEFAGAEKEAAEIIEDAKKQAESISEDAEAELRLIIEKRTKIAMERIASYEQNAINEIKTQTISLSRQIAENSMKQAAREGQLNSLFDNSLANIQQKLH